MSDADDRFEFRGEVRRYSGDAAWYFVTLPLDLAEELRERTDGLRGGFGSIRVEVELGSSRWSTSVFPDRRSGSFMLPVKKAVRAREDLEDGDPVDVTLTLALAM